MNRNHVRKPKEIEKKNFFGHLSKISISQTFPFFNKSTKKKSKLSKTNNFKKLTCQRKEHFEGIWEKENKGKKMGMRG